MDKTRGNEYGVESSPEPGHIFQHICFPVNPFMLGGDRGLAIPIFYFIFCCIKVMGSGCLVQVDLMNKIRGWRNAHEKWIYASVKMPALINQMTKTMKSLITSRP